MLGCQQFNGISMVMIRSTSACLFAFSLARKRWKRPLAIIAPSWSTQYWITLLDACSLWTLSTVSPAPVHPAALLSNCSCICYVPLNIRVIKECFKNSFKPMSFLKCWRVDGNELVFSHLKVGECCKAAYQLEQLRKKALALAFCYTCWKPKHQKLIRYNKKSNMSALCIGVLVQLSPCDRYRIISVLALAAN